MINLHLTGELTEIVGQEVVPLEARSPREVVTALAYQLPEYAEKLYSDNWHIFVGKNNDISEAELDLELGSVEDVYIMPVIEGAAVGIIIAGAALAGGSFFVSTALIATAMLAAGVGLMMSGVVQLLMKPPEMGETNTVDQNASFLFSGAVNTTKQGQPIPIGYGKMLCGSTVVSAALYAEDI